MIKKNNLTTIAAYNVNNRKELQDFGLLFLLFSIFNTLKYDALQAYLNLLELIYLIK